MGKAWALSEPTRSPPPSPFSSFFLWPRAVTTEHLRSLLCPKICGGGIRSICICECASHKQHKKGSRCRSLRTVIWACVCGLIFCFHDISEFTHVNSSCFSWGQSCFADSLNFQTSDFQLFGNIYPQPFLESSGSVGRNENVRVEFLQPLMAWSPHTSRGPVCEQEALRTVTRVTRMHANSTALSQVVCAFGPRVS